MKKSLILLALISIALLSSCRTHVDIQTQEMPAAEAEWANTLVNWYPEWVPPVVVQKDNSGQ